MKLFTRITHFKHVARFGTSLALTAFAGATLALSGGAAVQANLGGLPAADSNKDKLPVQRLMPLRAALEGAEAALKACEAAGHRVSVTVVDQSGNEKVLLKSDGAGPHTIASSKGKAFTAVSLRRSTGDLATFIADKPDLAELRDMDPRILILAGGLPVAVDNEVIGGIGVGGAPSGQIDAQCAQAGVDKIISETN